MTASFHVLISSLFTFIKLLNTIQFSQLLRVIEGATKLTRGNKYVVHKLTINGSRTKVTAMVLYDIVS